MGKRLAVLLMVLLFVSVFLQPGAFAQSRLQYPNDFGIELAGKSLIYTFTYQRMFNNYFGAEAGFSALSSGDSDDNTTVLFFPIGAKAYFLPGDGSPFVTGGLVLINASVDSGPFDESTSNTYTYLGAGFEFRAEGGFIFRGTAYGLLSEGNFFIWPGLTVGYAF